MNILPCLYRYTAHFVVNQTKAPCQYLYPEEHISKDTCMIQRLRGFVYVTAKCFAENIVRETWYSVTIMESVFVVNEIHMQEKKYTAEELNIRFSRISSTEMDSAIKGIYFFCSNSIDLFYKTQNDCCKNEIGTGWDVINEVHVQL